MKTTGTDTPASRKSKLSGRMNWPLVGGGIAVVVAALLLRAPQAPPSSGLEWSDEIGNEQTRSSVSAPGRSRPALSHTPALIPGVKPSAEQIVAGKLTQFAQSRRAHAYALARRHNVAISADVERFFDAVESGDWERIESAFKLINGGDSSAGHNSQRAPELTWIWPAIIDAYGVAEQVHEWPAQKPLDYGNAVLGALKPGMVYIGGTDNGRWIPELLNETAEGERHVIITQNGLADATYQDYVRLQYDDLLANLTEEDSTRAFNDYVADAQKRLTHDREFPEEPKQVRPGEEIQEVDGKIQVSGRVAVMGINERLLQALIEKNPERSFALQESFPLRTTYNGALPLGPIMELQAADGANGFTSERAAETLQYWQNATERAFADPEAAGSPVTLKSWSHDANSTANLLAARQHDAEAEQTYRLATQLWPGNPDPVAGLADLLYRNGQAEQARSLLQSFDRQYPDHRAILQGADSWRLLMSH